MQIERGMKTTRECAVICPRRDLKIMLTSVHSLRILLFFPVDISAQIIIKFSVENCAVLFVKSVRAATTVVYSYMSQSSPITHFNEQVGKIEKQKQIIHFVLSAVNRRVWLHQHYTANQSLFKLRCNTRNNCLSSYFHCTMSLI